MSPKRIIVIIALIFVNHLSSATQEETSSLEAIKSRVIEKAELEKILIKNKLTELDNQIATIKEKIEDEIKLNDNLNSRVDRYEKLIKASHIGYPRQKNLEQFLSALHGSQIITTTELSDEVLVISDRIFISEGRFFSYSHQNGFQPHETGLANTEILDSFKNLISTSNEVQPLGVAVGKKEIEQNGIHVEKRRFSILQFVGQGGVIGKLIIVNGLIVLFIGFRHIVKLRKFRRLLKNQCELKNLIFAEYYAQNETDYDNQRKELLLSKILHKQTTILKGNLDYIKFIATISPMMGLLGTVSGLIVTFQAINLTGSNDSTFVAAGISQALTTTILGLVVAAPSLFLFTFLSNQVKTIEETLEQIAYDLLINKNDE